MRAGAVTFLMATEMFSTVNIVFKIHKADLAMRHNKMQLSSDVNDTYHTAKPQLQHSIPMTALSSSLG